MNADILRRSFTLGAADFSKKALLAVTVLLCVRFLPAGTFGDYIFLLTFYQVFAVLGGAGIPSSLLRAVARNPHSGMRSGAASMLARLVYIVPTAALMYAAMWVLGLSGKYLPLLFLLFAMMALRGAAENIAFIFQGNEDPKSSAKVGVSQSAVTLLATLAVCLTSKDLRLLIGAHVLGAFVSTMYGVALLQRSRQSEERGSIFGAARALLAESHWLNAGTFVSSAYNRIDVLLLRRLITSEAVAIYGAPYRILDLTQIVPSSLMASLLPSLCRKREMEPGMAHPGTALRFLLITAFCVIAAVTVAAPWITFFLFGPKYEGSVPVLRILIWATLPMFWNCVLNAQLIAHSFDRAILYAAGFALVTNGGLNLLLIPRFGYMACAVVTVITECALLGASLHFAAKVRAIVLPEHCARLALAATLCAGFCLCWTMGGPRRVLASGALLAASVAALPVFRSDIFRAWAGEQSSTTIRPTQDNA